jgi:asparagine synthase (glutamine-hydrolysing)
MCGIAGIFEPGASHSEESMRRLAGAISAALRHRGPDDEGIWADAAAGIALASRRLAIIDLSPAGHQPMVSVSGRYVIAYNGETYNHPELRQELENQVSGGFRGHSDTEVLLAAFEAWGVRPAVERLNGMFAFALWDQKERVLHLARDRMGEKPLYYGWIGGALVFASEMKALRCHPDFRGEIDAGALALYLRHNCVPAPHTIFRGMRKLPPATVVSISSSSPQVAEPVPYWSLRQAAEAGLAKPFTGSEPEAAEELDRLLREAVRTRMMADVPLGAFLSGGIDSSTVVALMQAQSDRPVKTFSIGLLEPGYNEAEEAKAVAQHLRTEHTELYVTPPEARAVIPLLPAIYGEPFADQSQIPTFLVSQLARRQVTVALSGDGGDELFGGYNRYTWSGRIWRNIGGFPEKLRKAAAAAITSLSPRGWEAVFRTLRPVLPQSLRPRLPGDKLHKMAGVMGAEDLRALYIGLASHWDPATVTSAAEPSTLLTSTADWPALSDFAQQMMFLDTLTYLPDDILTKLDRASMAVSLEARLPLLDPRVVEFAWRLPASMKIRGQEGKWLLRRVLDRYIPSELTSRPKMGFGVPLDAWLRGPLREWAEALLDPHRLASDAFLHPRPIRRKWAEHLSGRRNWQFHLWDVLMFQAWLEETRRPAAEAPTAAVLGVS